MSFFRRLFGRAPKDVIRDVPAQESASLPVPCRSRRISETDQEQPSRRYLPITRDFHRDLSPVKQEQMREIARHLWRSNEIAKRGILNLRSFVASEGFKARSLAADAENRTRVQRFLDRWWERNEWDERLSKRVETLCVEGEWFYWEGVPDAEGISKLGLILPENVRYVERDPLNAERMVAVTLQKPLEFDIGHARYTKQHLKIIDECCMDGDVYYLQLNALSGQTRGMSDLLVVSDSLDYLEALTFAEIERVQFQKNFSCFVNIDSDNPNDILAKRDELIDEGPPSPGSVKVVGKGENWEAKSPDLKLADSVEFMKRLELLCFGGLIMPEHYFSSGGDVNKATSANMDTPVFAFTRDRKNLIRGFLHLAISKAIRSGVKAGTLAGIPEEDLKFEVTSRDPDRSAYDLIGDMLFKLGQALTLGQERGYVSDVEAARVFRIAASGLGLGDFQAVNEQSLEQAREMARQRLELQAIQLQGPFPISPPSLTEAEDGEKKKLLEDLVRIARQRGDSALAARTASETFANDIWQEVVANLVKRGRAGGQLTQDDIQGVLDRLKPEFTKRFPTTDLTGAIEGGRRAVQATMGYSGVDTPDGRKKYPRVGRPPIERSLYERVVDTTVKEPKPGAARSAGGRRRSLGREVQYSQIHWAREDIRNAILQRLEKAREDGETLESFARGLSRDKSLVKVTAKNVARNIIHSEQRAAKIAESLLYEDIGEREPGTVRMRYVRVNAKGKCSKCDPLDGKTFAIDNPADRKKYEVPQHKGCRCTWIPDAVGDAAFVSELGERLADVKTFTSDRVDPATQKDEPVKPSDPFGDILGRDDEGGPQSPDNNDSSSVSSGDGDEEKPIFGQWKTAQGFHASLWRPGMTPHKAQELRRRELAKVVGERPAAVLAEAWTAWQTGALMDKSRQLLNVWEDHRNGSPSLRPELRDALVASRNLIAQTIIAPVRLYRGFDATDWSTNLDEVLAAAALGRKYVLLTVRSMNSWSSSLHIAKDFVGEKGFIAEALVSPRKIVGGLGLSPGFAVGEHHSDELEVVVSAFETINGEQVQIFPLSQITSESWQGRDALRQAEWMRMNEPEKLEAIVAEHGEKQKELTESVKGSNPFEGLSFPLSDEDCIRMAREEKALDEIEYGDMLKDSWHLSKPDTGEEWLKVRRERLLKERRAEES